MNASVRQDLTSLTRCRSQPLAINNTSLGRMLQIDDPLKIHTSFLKSPSMP